MFITIIICVLLIGWWLHGYLLRDLIKDEMYDQNTYDGPGEEDGPWAEGFVHRIGDGIDEFPIVIGFDLASGPDVSVTHHYESNLHGYEKVGEEHD